MCTFLLIVNFCRMTDRHFLMARLSTFTDVVVHLPRTVLSQQCRTVIEAEEEHTGRSAVGLTQNHRRLLRSLSHFRSLANDTATSSVCYELTNLGSKQAVSSVVPWTSRQWKSVPPPRHAIAAVCDNTVDPE